MALQDIKERLVSKSIFFSEDGIGGRPTVIGYEKKFRWRWMATQLNTFIVASDCGEETITAQTIEEFLTEAFQYAKKNYSGWPRGLQSGVGVIGILLSTSVSDDAQTYCKELKSGKKWAGFAVPVAVDVAANQVYAFEKNPMWGRIYFPHFKALIADLT